MVYGTSLAGVVAINAVDKHITKLQLDSLAFVDSAGRRRHQRTVKGDIR